MKREILINANPRETRVAIIEDEQLSELLVDRPEARRMVGDIYFGRVDAVLPGRFSFRYEIVNFELDFIG